MDKKQVINEIKTYLASHDETCKYNIVHHENSIVIEKISARRFNYACWDWYNDKKNRNKMFGEYNARFERIDDYTFCITKRNGETRYGIAKRYKDDPEEATAGRVVAFAHAIGQDPEHMIGLK